MPKAVLMKRGDEYLPDVSLAEPEETYKHEPPGKSGDRLQAAVPRKRGKMIVEMATISGLHPSTIHRWLHRLEREGPEGGYDRWDPGRPRLLTPEQSCYAAYRSGTAGRPSQTCWPTRCLPARDPGRSPTRTPVV